jgi:hypothetical protein
VTETLMPMLADADAADRRGLNAAPGTMARARATASDRTSCITVVFT